MKPDRNCWNYRSLSLIGGKSEQMCEPWGICFMWPMTTVDFGLLQVKNN